jgi:hypothetical protein
MPLTPTGFTSDGLTLGVAAAAWIAATAWLLERITATLYDTAFALIKTASAANGGG